ncbi:hypothetical protein GCM10010038_28170 [Glutamicibacter protophormiae]|nr:hypothetical protein GCM10010038_28170 [Glutamicibacter protophormiae]
MLASTFENNSRVLRLLVRSACTRQRTDAEAADPHSQRISPIPYLSADSEVSEEGL